MLRPGVHVLRRSASELQVGLDPRRAVVLPDRPDVRALLQALTSPATLPEAYDGRTLEALTDSGLLVDADVLLPLVPSPGREAGRETGQDSGPHQGGHPGRDRDTGAGPTALSSAGGDRLITRSSVAALAADCGDRAAALVDRRSSAHVEVLTCGAPEAVPVASRVLRLLSGAGVSTRLLPHAGPHGDPVSGATCGSRAGSRRDSDRRAEAGPAGNPPPVVPPEAAVIGLLVAVGEPQRELLDSWMREGTPHLLLRLTEGHAVLGPFVVPGRTACLRCVDAHHTDVDPAWPLLVTQYATAAARTRADTVPEPVDELLSTLATAWAARELVTRAERREPTTVSATVRLDPLLTALESQHWPRHPACGCSWG